MTAPRCGRCNGTTIYIGISGAAEAACMRSCADRCPYCLSLDIEEFRDVFGTFGGDRWHCLPCGRLFDAGGQ